MKKGVSEFVFKIIFATVAGSLIMIFLFRFAFEQADLFGRIDVRELVINLDHQLDALSVVPNSNKIIDLGGKYELNFDCNSISSKDFRREIEHIAFTQSSLKGSKLQAWTRTWKFPYAVTNFYYLANEKNKFILVYDNNNYDFVKNLRIPEIFDVQYVNINRLDLGKVRKGSLEAENVVFVFFNRIANNNEIKKEIPNSKTIYIDYTNNNVRFYDKNIESFYLGEEMLIGAIFSVEDYECVKDRAIERLGDISNLYRSKLNLLMVKEQRESCRSKLVSLANTLEVFSKQKSKTALYEAKRNIEKQNDELEKNDCATAY